MKLIQVFSLGAPICVLSTPVPQDNLTGQIPDNLSNLENVVEAASANLNNENSISNIENDVQMIQDPKSNELIPEKNVVDNLAPFEPVIFQSNPPSDQFVFVDSSPKPQQFLPPPSSSNLNTGSATSDNQSKLPLYQNPVQPPSKYLPPISFQNSIQGPSPDNSMYNPPNNGILKPNNFGVLPTFRAGQNLGRISSNGQNVDNSYLPVAPTGYRGFEMQPTLYEKKPIKSWYDNPYNPVDERPNLVGFPYNLFNKNYRATNRYNNRQVRTYQPMGPYPVPEVTQSSAEASPYNPVPNTKSIWDNNNQILPPNDPNNKYFVWKCICWKTCPTGYVWDFRMDRCTQGERAEACNSNPCFNMGTCSNQPSSYICQCSELYAGERCQWHNQCRYSRCQEGTCQVIGDYAYQCVCNDGYTGIDCETQINFCDSSPCLNNGLCQDGLTEFTCDCSPGYQGISCAEDVDECLSNPCGDNFGVSNNVASCNNLIDEWQCQCLDGWDGEFCDQDIDECASGPCDYEGSEECIFGLFTCTCKPGYEGTTCQTNIDECQSNPCSPTGTLPSTKDPTLPDCQDDINKFVCPCKTGPFYYYDTETCITFKLSILSIVLIVVIVLSIFGAIIAVLMGRNVSKAEEDKKNRKNEMKGKRNVYDRSPSGRSNNKKKQKQRTYYYDDVYEYDF